MSSRNQKSGWSLVEVIISAALFATLLAGATRGLNQAFQLYRTTNRQLDIDARLDRTVDRLRQELALANLLSVTPVLLSPVGGPTTWSDTLTFTQVAGWDEGALVPTGPRMFWTRLEGQELDDGLDQDGDGLIDELELVLTLDVGADQRNLVIARDILEWMPGETSDGLDENGNGLVDEPGLSFTLVDGVIDVRLALGIQLPNGSTSVRTRNFSVALSN